MVDVFMSYSHRDTQVADAVRGRLAQAGIKVASDQELQTGERWAKNIQRWIRNAANGLLLLSPSSLNSASVAREYQGILAQNKHLYVALVSPVFRQQIPYELQDLQQYVDLTSDFDEGVSKLIEAIKDKQEIVSDKPLAQAVPEEELSPNTVELKVDRKKDDVDQIIADLKKHLDAGAHTIKIVNDDDQ
jgi:hypothetical protein